MGRLTPTEAEAAVQAMPEHARADVRALQMTPCQHRHVEFTRMCHARQWSRDWAVYVQSIISAAEDDDIPF